MSDETTGRLALPMIAPGQAAKELTHNEALAMLDLVVQAGVVAAGVDDPPAQPRIGDAWIVGPAPTGAWTGRANAIAGWTAGGWRFVAPREGTTAWVASAKLDARFRGGGWVLGILRVAQIVVDGLQVLGARAAPIAEPVGGGAVDAEARVTLAAILSALRDHGLIER